MAMAADDVGTKSKLKPRSQSKPKSNSRASTLTFDQLGSTSNSTAKTKKSLTSIIAPPLFSTPLPSQSQPRLTHSPEPSSPLQSSSPKQKGDKAARPTRKGKEKASVIDLTKDGEKEINRHGIPLDEPDTRLWVEKYEPRDIEELAIHRRKVEDVRRWLLEAFEGGLNKTLKKYRRILALTGPAGTGKTATIRVLSRELGYEILEWKNDIDERYTEDDGIQRETLTEKFDAFLDRASMYGSILASLPSTNYSPVPSTPFIASTSASTASLASASISPSQTPSTQPTSSLATKRRRIILIEDLPNISHSATQEAFHNTLLQFIENRNAIGVPVVLIISDEGRRGITEDGMDGRSYEGKVDVRTVLPPGALSGLYVQEIRFNPTPPTMLKKALQTLLSRANPLASSQAKVTKSNKDLLDTIVEGANGDMRSAIMAMEFAYGTSNGATSVSIKTTGRKKKGTKENHQILEFITQRENTLALFHLLGKVLYNKRKGDPSPQSASAKEDKAERDSDAKLLDLPKLPLWLVPEERRRSRVDVQALYADSPIDTSLYTLYLHQNYTKFCEDEDQCGKVCEWMSYVDALAGGGSGLSGDSYSYQSNSQVNPYTFHLLTLGMLHSLPSPAIKTGGTAQRMNKPTWFEALKKEREVKDALGEVAEWLERGRTEPASGKSQVMGDGYVGRWGMKEIACEMGAVLNARWKEGDEHIPSSYKLFADMKFTSSTVADGDVGEEGDIDDSGIGLLGASRGEDDGEEIMKRRQKRQRETLLEQQEVVEKGWLEDDEIEEDL